MTMASTFVEDVPFYSTVKGGLTGNLGVSYSMMSGVHFLASHTEDDSRNPGRTVIWVS